MSEPENPPAFPVPQFIADKTRTWGGAEMRYPITASSGMSLRDWFAGQALAAIRIPGITADRAAQVAYTLADAMLAERAKGGAK